MLAEEMVSAFWLARPDKEASSEVTAEGKVAEFMAVLSLPDRNPFKTDRSGLGKLSGPGMLVEAAEPATAEGRGLEAA